MPANRRQTLKTLLAGIAAMVAGAWPRAVPASPDGDVDFWALVERSRKGGRGGEDQVAALSRLLDALPEEDILRFERAYNQAMVEAYSWDLWGAGYVIHGGLSDDGFVYFRAWLIAQGREVFSAAQSDPDALAGLIPADAAEPLELESLAYAAGEAWGRKTGRPLDDPAWQSADMVAMEREPSGAPFKDDPAALAARYPRLWARFGDEPLG